MICHLLLYCLPRFLLGHLVSQFLVSQCFLGLIFFSIVFCFLFVGPGSGRDDIFLFSFSYAARVGVLLALCPGGDGAEGGSGDEPRSSLSQSGRKRGSTGAAVFPISLMLSLRHRMNPWSAFSIPSNKIELEIFIVSAHSNYLLDYFMNHE